METKRLKLYAASQEQMVAFIAAQSDAVLKAAYTEMLNGCLTHPDQWEWHAIWMIELKDGTRIGEFCFKGITEKGSTEIGYGIEEGYRGQGYATEAVSALVDWALRQPGVTCVTAETEASNIASQRVLRKAGFRPTGETGEEGPIFIRRKVNVEAYRKYMTSEILMGPNSARILGELLEKHPLRHSDTDIVLDLGCGKGLTSLVLAKETGAKVYASDLWNTVEENQKRFVEWGVEHQVVPFCEDANELHFEKDLFSALVSVDAYHYFGTKGGFFVEKMLPLLKNGATVLFGIPGIKDAYAGHAKEFLSEWLGNDAYMFQSPSTWKEIIGHSERIESVETWEMECFDDAWMDWLNTDNEYALGDKRFFDTHIRPYSCLVGICIKIK